MLAKQFQARDPSPRSWAARQLTPSRWRRRSTSLVTEPARVAHDEVLVLVVTDLEGFTPLVCSLGDVEARMVMRQHNQLLRGRLRAHGGFEVAHTGDGIMAAFRSVIAALKFAASIQDRLLEYSTKHPNSPLRIRAGVHAGEPLVEDGRLFGTCVNTTVRICGAAEASSVLVSEVVCMLASGKDSVLRDRGYFHLKGVAAPIRLHELLWRQEPPVDDGTRTLGLGAALADA